MNTILSTTLSDKSLSLAGRTTGSKPTGQSPLPSATLLQGHKAVNISHNGMLYTLQATKLGKLILTK